MSEIYDVIIIGAGVSGLAAAKELSNNGFRVLILEARERIGGRIYSIRDPLEDYPIELGAEFIHGRPEETFSILQAAGLEAREVNGNRWTANHGRLTKSGWDENKREEAIWQKMREVEDDQSLQSLLNTYFSSEEWREAAEIVSGFVQGFDAARPDRVSIKWLLKEQEFAAQIGGDTNHRLSVAYDSVPRWLLAACNPAKTEICLNTIVKEVHWQTGGVEVMAESGLGSEQKLFRARCALVTLPIGVLQAPNDGAGAVRFTPALRQKEWALEHIDMGQVAKVILRFRERFWEDALPNGGAGGMTDLGYLISDNAPVRVWWTQNPLQSSTLTAWVGALEAAKLAQESETTIAGLVITALAKALGVERSWVESQVQAWYFHNWKADPFARGVYSYIAAGGVEAVQALAQPLGGTLFFAGEGTDMGWHIGTVHGAIGSGQRAAREIKERLKS